MIIAVILAIIVPALVIAQSQTNQNQKQKEVKKNIEKVITPVREEEKPIAPVAAIAPVAKVSTNGDACLDAMQKVFPKETWQMAKAIHLAEGGQPNMIPSASGDYGCWQINKSAHFDGKGGLWCYKYTFAQVADPIVNAKIAYELSMGGKNWSAWTTYTSGKYLKYLSD